MYNDIERLRDEPHAVRVQCDEDIQVTDEVYRRPVFLQPSYRSFPPPPPPPLTRGRGSWHPLSHMSSMVVGMKPLHGPILTRAVPIPAGTTGCPCLPREPLWRSSLMLSSASSG